MDDNFKFADELGPVKMYHVHEPSIGLKGVLVVDNVAAGPSIGGLRMAPDVSTEECCRLAKGHDHEERRCRASARRREVYAICRSQHAKR